MKTGLRFRWQQRRAWLTALAGVLASAGAALWQQHTNDSIMQARLNDIAVRTGSEVAQRMHIFQYGLNGARGAILTAGADRITAAQFRDYARSRDIAREFGGARGFGFVRRVAEGEQAAFVARQPPGFAIRQFDGASVDPGDRFVVEMIEPIERTRAALGLDLGSEPVRRAAALAAMASGEARMTAPIALVQPDGRAPLAFLLMMPVYRGAVTPPPERRDAELTGWIYAPLEPDAMLRQITADHDIEAGLVDVGAGRAPITILPLAAARRAGIPVASDERDIYGRRWRLTARAGAGFIARQNLTAPSSILATGLLCTGALTALAVLAAAGRRRRWQIRAEQAKLAAIVDSSIDAIIGKDLDGTITSWNRGAQMLFGHSAAEAIGRQVGALLVPPHLQEQEVTLLARLHAGEAISDIETQRLHKDGRLIDVWVSVSPILGPDGLVTGAAKTVRDITERKAAEARVLGAKAQLESTVASRTLELRSLNLLLGSVLDAATEVAIIATDLDGTVTLFNRGAEAMLGYQAADIVGQVTPAVFHDHDEVAARAAELSAREGAPVEGLRIFTLEPGRLGSETREWTFVRKDGDRIIVSLIISAMVDEAGQCSGYLGIAIDISQRKAAETRLAWTRDQLVLAAEAAQLGIWSWDIASNGHAWNDQMFQLYQQDPALLDHGLGYRHWEERVHPDDLDTASARLRDGLNGHANFDQTFRIVRPDGQVRYVQAGGRIERDAGGKPVRVTGVNLDITERMEMLNVMRRAKEEADAASEAKSTFLANMSHEIRTPMNAVMGMLQLVQRTALDARQRDYIGKAERAALSLLQLLNDVLDYSKIEAGKLRLDPAPFELDALMRDLAAVLSGNQGARDVEVMFDMDPRLPATLVGDRLRLQQVLINLAGNALKFTERGSVKVVVEQLAHDADGVRMRVSVTDTGIGISADQQACIFDGFTQAEASISRRFGGTGLGLVICRRLVELMGGRLELASALGEGSRFFFEVVLGTPAKSPTAAATLAPADKVLKVLIVDDQREVAQVLARMVEGLGWRACLAGGSDDAMAQLVDAAADGAPFELVLMDWRMPQEDGVSAAHRIRAAFGRTPPVVIMVTAHGREMLLDQLLDQQSDGAPAPFADILTKPVTPQMVAQAVARALAGSPAATAPLPRQARLAGLRLLLVEDNALNRQVARELLEGEGALVESAEDGQAALARLHDGALPDCVLMDMQMPVMDGLEATRQIRASFGQALPIIAMTANAAAADRARCLAAGMSDHVGKPIDIERLVAVLLVHGRGDAPVEEAATAIDAVSPGERADEPAALVLARFGNDRALYARTLDALPAALEQLLAPLRADADAATAGAALHAIKGLAATVGARAVADLADAAERAVRLGQPGAAADFAAGAPHLIAAAHQRLRATAGDSEHTAAATTASITAPSLDGLDVLLAGANMRALDIADQLAPHAPPGSALARLVAHIRALEFNAAAALLARIAAGQA